MDLCFMQTMEEDKKIKMKPKPEPELTEEQIDKAIAQIFSLMSKNYDVRCYLKRYIILNDKLHYEKNNLSGDTIKINNLKCDFKDFLNLIIEALDKDEIFRIKIKKAINLLNTKDNINFDIMLDNDEHEHK